MPSLGSQLINWTALEGKKLRQNLQPSTRPVMTNLCWIAIFFNTFFSTNLPCIAKINNIYSTTQLLFINHALHEQRIGKKAYIIEGLLRKHSSLKSSSSLQMYQEERNCITTMSVIPRISLAPTFDSNRETSERSRSPSLSNDFILLASLFNLSLSNFISSYWRVLTSFCTWKLLSSSLIHNSFLARDDSSSWTCKSSYKQKPLWETASIKK